MEDNKNFKLVLAQMELHLEEEVYIVNDILKENVEIYDNETIVFYLKLRSLFKEYKKELRKLIKEVEQRKDN